MISEQSLLAELNQIRQCALTSEQELIDPLRRLAEWYCENRLPHRARPHLLELWTLCKRTAGETDRATVDAASWLASNLVSSGKSDRAENLLAELVVKVRKDKKLPIDRRAAIWNQLVEVYYHRTKLAEALHTCQELLAMLRDQWSQKEVRNDPACISQMNRARNNLGALYVANGKFLEAQRVFVRHLRVTSRQLPANDLSLVSQLSNLAVVMRLRGLAARSERLTIKAIRQCQKTMGWYHPLVAQGLANLAGYRLKGGRPGSALKLFRKALKIRRRLHPVGHIQISRSLRQLAEAQLAVGQHARAERLLERTRARIEKQAPLDELQLAQTLSSLGFVYLAAGRLANCDRTLTQALQLQEKILGPSNSQLIQTLNGLGCLNAARAKYEVAQSFQSRALALAEQQLGPNHPELARTLIWLSEIALSRGNIDEAQTVVDRALLIRQTSLGAEHPLVAEVLIQSANVALAQGKPAQALSMGAQAKMMCLKSPENLPLALADVLAVAAEASYRLHRFRGVENLSQEELKLREPLVGTSHVTLLPAIKRLAWAFLKQGNLEAADPTLRRGLAISEKTLGVTHEVSIYFAEYMGRLSLEKQDFDEASHWLERTVKLYQRLHGDDAEQVADKLLKFAGYLRAALRETDADDFERRAIDLRNRNCHVLL